MVLINSVILSVPGFQVIKLLTGKALVCACNYCYLTLLVQLTYKLRPEHIQCGN